MALLDRLRFWRKADAPADTQTTTVQRSATPFGLPIGDALGHYAVYAAWALQYRASLSVNLQLQQRIDGVWQTEPNHPAVAMWEYGNAEFDASELLAPIWWGVDRDALAMIRVLRNENTRAPLGWEVLANEQVEIRNNPNGSGLQYRLIQDRGPRLDITDSVIPIRWGGPLTLEKQVSPVRAILDQLYLGRAATRFMSIRATDPPNLNWIISPNVAPNMQFQAPTQEQLAAFTQQIREAAYSLDGDKVRAMGLPLRIDTLETPLTEETLTTMVQSAEYAVCAVLGIDPDDLQLRAGLTDSHSYASVVEARRKTWQDGLMPMLDLLASRLTRRWLPEFVPITDRNQGDYRLVWDYSGVPALADDLQLHSDVYGDAYRNGAMSVEEYRERIGLSADMPEGTYFNTRQPLEFADDDDSDLDVA